MIIFSSKRVAENKIVKLNIKFEKFKFGRPDLKY